MAELIEAANNSPYKIYRIYDLTDDGAHLRVSDDISPLASKLKKLHEEHMPAGVRVDGFSISTTALSWRDEIYVERLEDEGGG